jgi:hypothetical protein
MDDRPSSVADEDRTRLIGRLALSSIGHGGSTAMDSALIAATDRFATRF